MHDEIGATTGSYSGVGGVVGDYDWSDSSATNPTESHNASDETPNTVMTTNNSKAVVKGGIRNLEIAAFMIFQMIHACYFQKLAQVIIISLHTSTENMPE